MDSNMDNEQIAIRFFTALSSLKAKGTIHGINNFTDRYGIDRRNLYQLKKNPSRGIFKPWWLSALVNDYNISPMWLLTGKGNMYVED